MTDYVFIDSIVPYQYKFKSLAEVVELVDTSVSKTDGLCPCRFDSGLRYQKWWRPETLIDFGPSFYSACSINFLMSLDGHQVTISTRTSTFNDNNVHSCGQLLKLADKAMYKAKSSGKDRISQDWRLLKTFKNYSLIRATYVRDQFGTPKQPAFFRHTKWQETARVRSIYFTR